MTKCQKCNKSANFGPPNTKKRLFCTKHRASFHVNIYHVSCKYEGCRTTASYGKTGSNTKEYCFEHSKLMGSCDLKVPMKICIEGGCETLASYAQIGKNIPLYCKKHAHKNLGEDNVCVRTKRCIEDGCFVAALYGDPVTKIKSTCNKHKEPHHISLSARKCCVHVNCDTAPSYEDPNSKDIKVCSAHKEDWYVLMKGFPICQHEEGCTTVASFGLPNTKKKLYCVKHCPDDMYVYLNSTRKCEKCNTTAGYGAEGTKDMRFCAKHKNPEHVHLTGTLCKDSECKVHASFGYPGFKPEYCVEHQEKTMVYRPHKRKRGVDSTCSYCTMEINYDQEFCSNCKRYIDMGKTVKRHQKEETIKELLKNNFDKECIRHDRKVEFGCTNRRPDFELTANWGTIILEVDEYQHNRKTYPCSCEITRMKEIYFDCGVENLLFIRYNPDSYLSLEGYAKPERALQRQEFLIKFLQEQLADKKFEHLGVVYLYYDGFSRQSIEIESLDPYGA